MAKKDNKQPAPPNNPGVPSTGTSTVNQEQIIKTTKTTTKTTTSGTGYNTAGLTPEQVTQLQLEEAIKESQNPSMKLKKLRSPLSLKGCLLNALLFVVLTLVCVFAYIAFFKVNNFNLWFIIKDMLKDFGITDFFSKIFKAIGNFFRGNKGGEAAERILQLIIKK